MTKGNKVIIKNGGNKNTSSKPIIDPINEIPKEDVDRTVGSNEQVWKDLLEDKSEKKLSSSSKKRKAFRPDIGRYSSNGNTEELNNINNTTSALCEDYTTTSSIIQPGALLQ